MQPAAGQSLQTPAESPAVIPDEPTAANHHLEASLEEMDRHASLLAAYSIGSDMAAVTTVSIGQRSRARMEGTLDPCCSFTDGQISNAPLCHSTGLDDYPVANAPEVHARSLPPPTVQGSPIWTGREGCSPTFQQPSPSLPAASVQASQEEMQPELAGLGEFLDNLIAEDIDYLAQTFGGIQPTECPNPPSQAQLPQQQQQQQQYGWGGGSDPAVPFTAMPPPITTHPLPCNLPSQLHPHPSTQGVQLVAESSLSLGPDPYQQPVGLCHALGNAPGVMAMAGGGHSASIPLEDPSAVSGFAELHGQGFQQAYATCPPASSALDPTSGLMSVTTCPVRGVVGSVDLPLHMPTAPTWPSDTGSDHGLPPQQCSRPSFIPAFGQQELPGLPGLTAAQLQHCPARRVPHQGVGPTQLTAGGLTGGMEWSRAIPSHPPLGSLVAPTRPPSVVHESLSRPCPSLSQLAHCRQWALTALLERTGMGDLARLGQQLGPNLAQQMLAHLADQLLGGAMGCNVPVEGITSPFM